MTLLNRREAPLRHMAQADPDPSTVRYAGRWTHRDVSANGIRLHIAEAGDGPLVLLLHGFPEFWWAWRHQLGALAEAGFHAVAVDLRGYGDSDKPPRGYDGWTLAGDVAGLIRALGERTATLVGHAWGGMLAWTVAAMHPRLVDRLAVIGAPHPLALRRSLWHGMTRPWVAQGRKQSFAAGHAFGFQLPFLPERRLRRDGAAAVERIMRTWAGADWAADPDFAEVVDANRRAMLVPGAAHCALEYFRWAARTQLRREGRKFADIIDRRAAVPVLQLHGTADPCMLESTALASAPWLGPRSRYHALPGIGHFPHEEDPITTNRLLIDFLS